MQAKYRELSTILLAPIGRDAFGHLLVDELSNFGMRTDGLLRTGKDTAVCNMVLDNTGTLVGGVADMSIMESVTGKQVKVTASLLAEALGHTYLHSDHRAAAATRAYAKYCCSGWKPAHHHHR